VPLIREQKQKEVGLFHRMQKDQRESAEEWGRYCTCKTRHVNRRLRRIRSYSRSPFISTLEYSTSNSWQIPSGPFASYGIDLPLSTPAIWFTAHYVAAELFPNYYLFENIWFNLLSGTRYGPSCSLETLWIGYNSKESPVLWYYALIFILHQAVEVLLALGEWL
jgi:hypothetical protein